ncbi:uncharacterized protein TNCV_1390091 [Trichonephila clavipes]|nr:uncharacterized protein TNCV_1390091 [Trichonephila clavipes]
MCLPNPVSQKAYDRINAKIADISEALANASMKKAAAEEKLLMAPKNHSGSAGGMEVCGMQKIFFRLSQKHRLKYQRYIGDGDSKTFLSIAEKEPYGDSVPIKLSNGKTIGGKGRLTDAIISKLTTFYGNAIRANSHNVNEMRQAVWAVSAHTSSTDDEPNIGFAQQAKIAGRAVVNVIRAPFDYVGNQKRMVLLPEGVGEKGFLESRSHTFRIDSSRKGHARRPVLRVPTEGRRHKRDLVNELPSNHTVVETLAILIACATIGLLSTDHVILNHGQVTWTTPELAPPLLTTTHTCGKTYQLSTDLTCIAALHGGSLVVLGSNSWQGKPRSDKTSPDTVFKILNCRGKEASFR